MLLLQCCPAGVSAAGWVLLTLGLSLPATPLTELDPGFSICRQSFYRQTPPLGLSGGDGALLAPLCNKLPGGQLFATLYHPTCDAAVYSGFLVSQGWGETGEEVGTEKEEEDDEKKSLPKVMTPALFRGATEEFHPAPDSPFHQWDAVVAELIRSSVLPQCGSTGGQLYILTGATGLGPEVEEVGDEGCETGVLWSAVCCAGPEGQSGFSLGVVREPGGQDERVVGVKELEDIIGVTDLFSEGCLGTDRDKEGDMVTLLSEAMVGIAATRTVTTEEVEVGEEEAAEPLISPSVDNATLSSESDMESTNSTLLYVLISSVSLLSAPLCHVVSTLSRIPGQVTYVVQEDMVVLCALPGDTLRVFYNMVSDLVSGVGSVTALVVGVGEMCFSILYSITAPLVGTLLTSCQDGVTGVGTLVWDGVGIFQGLMDSAWWASGVVGDQAWEQVGGYVGVVGSEIGKQLNEMGGGLGKLAWKCGNGMGNVKRMVEWLVVGSMETVVDNVMEAFGQNQN
ncbi:endonuclease domain-containing 1 protein isoform X1 [Esox lucius]|uniref:endonuclease domain-containing 1 protein isoform X1 n=1 Tax=Esox lucius TaxID=8010 RepID=UPI001476ACEB|nr:endonuclease domain-containing 1 protein isoform X1 [Esox lucius]